MMSGLWIDPIGRHHSDNPGDDQVLFEWMLGHTAHAITNFENPLFSTAMNVPWGANLMANTSVVAIGIILAPITWIFGAPVTYALAMTLGLFGTAAGWYYLMRRHLGLSAMAAGVGGALCAFGPSTIAHANGHLNFTALVCVPFIIIAILRLREPDRTVRGGLTLGALLIVEIFIGEEVVFLIAVFMAVFGLVYSLVNWAEVKPLLGRYTRGLGVAAGIAIVALAYPLWMQFWGPQSYAGIPWKPEEFPTDIASFVSFPTDSIAGRIQLPNLRLRHNITEENTFFGLPLAVLAICLTVMFFKRHKVLRALSITAAFFAVLSLGTQLRVNGNHTGIPGLYALVRPLPLFDSTIPTRFSLLLLPVIAILIAYGLQRVSAMEREAKLVWHLAVGLALVPLIPLPPSTEGRAAVPAFISSGAWKDHVSEGGTLVPVPIPENVQFDGMRWQEVADFGFSVPLGAFIGPDSSGAGQWSGKHLPTADLILETMDEGTVPVITDDDREQAVKDFKAWGAEAVVLGPHQFHYSLETLLTTLLGPGKRDVDVLVWDVDPKTGKVRG